MVLIVKRLALVSTIWCTSSAASIVSIIVAKSLLFAPIVAIIIIVLVLSESRLKKPLDADLHLFSVVIPLVLDCLELLGLKRLNLILHLAQLVNDLLESFSLVIIFLLDSLHLLSLEQLDLFSHARAHTCTLTLLDKLYRLVLIGHSGHMR